MHIPQVLQDNNIIFPDMDWSQAFIDAAVLGDERPTWAYDWPAGLRLAAALHTDSVLQRTAFHNTRVADLGCGRGMLGLCILHYNPAQVHFCDGSQQVLQYVDAIITSNHLQEHSCCTQHQWGTPIPGEPYDFILGGDILYRPECFADIFTTIACSLATHGQALLSDPREELEAEIPTLAAHAGLTLVQKRYENVTVLHLSLP